jgi:hypothetical protein
MFSKRNKFNRLFILLVIKSLWYPICNDIWCLHLPNGMRYCVIKVMSVVHSWSLGIISGAIVRHLLIIPLRGVSNIITWLKIVWGIEWIAAIIQINDITIESLVNVGPVALILGLYGFSYIDLHRFIAMINIVKLETYTQFACMNGTTIQNIWPNIQSDNRMSTTVNGMLNIVIRMSDSAKLAISKFVELCRVLVQIVLQTRIFPHKETITIRE